LPAQPTPRHKWAAKKIKGGKTENDQKEALDLRLLRTILIKSDWKAGGEEIQQVGVKVESS
jgi:hypothetical protein